MKKQTQTNNCFLSYVVNVSFAFSIVNFKSIHVQYHTKNANTNKDDVFLEIYVLGLHLFKRISINTQLFGLWQISHISVLVKAQLFWWEISQFFLVKHTIPSARKKYQCQSSYINCIFILSYYVINIHTLKVSFVLRLFVYQR